MVDFVWVDERGRKKRIRRAAKDAKGRTAQSRTAAEQHEHRIRAALAAGTDKPAETTPTLEAYLPRYIADAMLRLKPQTVDYVQRVYRNSLLPTLGEMPLDAIDQATLNELVRVLQSRDLGAKSVNNALSALRALLSHAAEHEVIDQVPRVKWQKVPPSGFDFFSPDEVPRLIEHAPPLVVVAVRTGMRIGELVELQWSDVSLDRKQVTVMRSVWWQDGRRIVGSPKNHRSRTIPLSADAHAVLTELHAGRRRSSHVFVGAAGQPLTPAQCKWPLWRAQDAAGLRRTGPHVLRHTFASLLVMRGVPLAVVQQLMGHATIQMTMKYAHLAPDALRDAIDSM